MKIIVKSVQLLLVIMAFFSIFCEVNPRENIEQVNPLPIPSVQIESRLIVPGNGTNLIHLQMSRQELVALLGKPNEEYEHNGYCSYSEMHWFPKANSDGSVEGDGVFVFLRDHKVFEIRFNKGYFTNQGITFGSSLKELQSKTSVLLYQLTKRANTSTNNEDLQFLIEKERVP